MPNCRFKVAADLSVAQPQAAEAHDACGVWWMRGTSKAIAFSQ